jgi:hypothetical protein
MPDNIRVFKVDFNEVDGPDGKTIEALPVRETDPLPAVGDQVLLLDEELNSCWGKVTALDAQIIVADLDLGTWMEPGPPQPAYASVAPTSEATVDVVPPPRYSAGFSDYPQAITTK